MRQHRTHEHALDPRVEAALVGKCLARVHDPSEGPGCLVSGSDIEDHRAHLSLVRYRRGKDFERRRPTQCRDGSRALLFGVDDLVRHEWHVLLGQ
jgi:hypothetical protein